MNIKRNARMIRGSEWTTILMETFAAYLKVDCNIPPSVCAEELVLDNFTFNINAINFLQNVWNRQLNDTASHPRRPEF
jgi:hypothetical protein